MAGDHSHWCGQRSQIEEETGWHCHPHSLVSDTQTEARGGESWFGCQAPSSVACGSNAPPPPPIPGSEPQCSWETPWAQSQGPEVGSCSPPSSDTSSCPSFSTLCPRPWGLWLPQLQCQLPTHPRRPSPLMALPKQHLGKFPGSQGLRSCVLSGNEGGFSWAPGSDDDEGLQHVCPLSLGKRQ